MVERSPLDGVLSAMVRRDRAIREARARGEPVPEAADATPTVSLKLMAAPGQSDKLAEAVKGLGGTITSQGYNTKKSQVLLAALPREKLADLSGIPSLLRAEAPRRFRHRLEDARGNASGCDQARVRHPDLDGTGVVIGIIDSGVDWAHPDFLDDDGKSRIELFLHANPDATFDRFDKARIDAALDGTGTVPQGDPFGHGTHCASVAAGGGRGDPRFRGVAPGATLIAARLDSGDDDLVIAAIREIFAAAAGRPCVLNISLGITLGPHDGTSAMENVIARESGRGRIVVVAAGNEADDRINAAATLTAGQPTDIPLTIRDPFRQIIDVWIARGDDVTDGIEIFDPAGQRVFPGFPLNPQVEIQSDGVNLDTNVHLIYENAPVGEEWTVRITPKSVTQGTVHAWAETFDPRNMKDVFAASAEPLNSLSIPATEERAISVACFVSRSGIVPAGAALDGIADGAISPFSSHGPARMGALRPDIAAPGQHVAAALAKDSDFATRTDWADRRLPGGQYICLQGTSTATPFVTGMVALMLQREPQLLPEEVQQRLRVTARRDAQTGRVWNPAYGYGKLDAVALLDYLGTG